MTSSSRQARHLHRPGTSRRRQGPNVLGAAGLPARGPVQTSFEDPRAYAVEMTVNAAVVLMFPIGVSAAAGLGVDPMPFVVAIVMAAAAAVATPIGYQTNLMVYGPGGYVFNDFLRAGVPLLLVTATVALTVIPRVWPF